LFERILQLNGYPISKAKERLEKIYQIPEEQYESYVRKQRLEIVNYHLLNNSDYRSFVGKNTIDHWENIPVMEKSNLQKPLQERLSKGFSVKNSYVNKTSGSSGQPFIFAKDKFCHALTWAEIMNRFGWFGINFNSSLQARFYGIPLDKKGYYKERIKDWLSHRYRFPIFDLSDSKLESFLTVFRRKKFYYLNGYTSSIVLFAKFLKRKNIVLTDICPSLKYCVVTSEMLFDSDKALLESNLGVRVINEYGAAELDLIAFTNDKDEFIVNSETLFVEILDDDNNSLPYGEAGKIIITSLYNKAHPLIRYEVGDLGVLSEKSTCKTPILKQLIGRTNDIATLPSGKTVPGLTFYYITKSVIENDGNVKEFIVEQTSIDLFTITYVSDRELTFKEIGSIQSSINIYLEDGLKFKFKRLDVLERKNRGKLKQFNSYL
jgi:phenylacetate-CoA ligase